MSLSTDQIALARQYLADPGSSAAQSILIENANAGTFTITYSGQTTSALAYNATPGDVQNALAALSNIGVGNVNVVGGPTFAAVAPWLVYFAEDLGNVAQVMLTVNSGSLTTAGPLTVVVTVTQVTAGGVQAFSDSDLNALYTDANLNLFLMVAYGFRVLLSNAAKFNDYTAGQSSEKKGEIFDHLKALADMYIDWAFAGTGEQVQIVSLKGVPPRLRAIPVTSGVPATSLQYAPPFSRRGRSWGSWGNW